MHPLIPEAIAAAVARHCGKQERKIGSQNLQNPPEASFPNQYADKRSVDWCEAAEVGLEKYGPRRKNKQKSSLT